MIVGGAITIRPDAKGLASLKKTNHFYVVENYIRRLVPQTAVRKCFMSAVLTDKNQISVVLEAIRPKYTKQCIADIGEMMEIINDPPSTLAKNPVAKNIDSASKKKITKPVEGVKNKGPPKKKEKGKGEDKEKNEKSDKEAGDEEEEATDSGKSSGAISKAIVSSVTMATLVIVTLTVFY